VRLMMLRCGRGRAAGPKGGRGARDTARRPVARERPPPPAFSRARFHSSPLSTSRTHAPPSATASHCRDRTRRPYRRVVFIHLIRAPPSLFCPLSFLPPRRPLFPALRPGSAAIMASIKSDDGGRQQYTRRLWVSTPRARHWPLSRGRRRFCFFRRRPLTPPARSVRPLCPPAQKQTKNTPPARGGPRGRPQVDDAGQGGPLLGQVRVPGGRPDPHGALWTGE